MIEAFKDASKRGDEISEIVQMIGPLFGISSDVKVDLTHSDLKEILKNDTLKTGNFDLSKFLLFLEE